VRGWLDCGLLVIDNTLCGQRTLTSRKDMLAASSAFKCYVYNEAKLSVLYTAPYRGTDKTLDRPGRKQANVSVRMA